MLVFQTQFSINNDATIQQLKDVGIKWILGSPHTSFKEEDLVSDEINFSYKNADEAIQIIESSNTSYEGLGIRYEKSGNSNDYWVTEVVGAKYENDYKITIQIFWQSDIGSRQIPKPKRPHIVKLILDEFGVAKDGELEVRDSAYNLNEQDLGLVDKIINGETSNKMPIVYISRQDDDTLFVDPKVITYHILGLAHVIVEPNRSFSYKLMDLSARQNVYGGAVGIYWPENMNHTRLFPYGKLHTPTDMGKKITDIIRETLISQKIDRKVTWAYIKELHFKNKLATLKEKGEVELDEYIRNFDEELKAKDEQVEQLENTINNLRQQLKGLRLKDENNSLLQAGENEELYPNEYNDLILTILNNELKNIQDKTRKKILLESLLASNQISGFKKQFMKKLHDVFDNYTSLSPKKRQILKGLNFEISEEGKHYKLKYKNYPAFQFTFAKTTSDNRAGKNNISTIKNNLFY
jgi:hypothetical protein